MTRFKIKIRKLLLWCLVLAIFYARFVKTSESPERECCDLKSTTTIGPLPLPPELPTVKTITSVSPQTIPTGRSGSSIKTAIAILNCILARQLCFEDPSCSAILEIIPRVCGPVPVACSTVTVTKCQAALRTLQAFPFFRPTCLCKEPGVDPDCNNFRDFLFDHPCGFVLKKEKDPYPIDALPTCNHALSVCQQERKCLKLFEDFKIHCKVRDNKCKMDDKDLCHEAWTNLRLSPMFGCICPNNHMKRRCDRIFSVVNHNPCVDIILLPNSHSSTIDTSSNSVYPISNANSQLFSSFPYFLFPQRKIPLALASHRPAIDDDSILSSSNNFFIYNLTNGVTYTSTSTKLEEHEHRVNNSLKYNSSHTSHQHKGKGFQTDSKSRPESGTGWIPHQQEEVNITEIDHFPVSVETQNSVRVMGMDESYHQNVFDENMALIETPLIAPPNTHYSHHYKTVSYPYNVTIFQGGGTSPDIIPIDGNSDSKGGQEILVDSSSEIIKSHFQSTCHIALEACREDPSCFSFLQPMLMHCELHRCNRNACMSSLQAFYKGPHEDLSLDIAFCLCKKTSNRHDTCMIAQEKLHPVCAQRPPDSLNPQNTNGIFYHPPPACHVVADLCKEDPECRSKLEHYEQACAIDSVTKKCAGRPSSCRSAMLGIFGTSLRATCACQGTDMPHLYVCLGWQKLLWLNPCIVESQKDFHIKRLAELGLLTTTTKPTTTTTITTTSSTTPQPITTAKTQFHQPFKPIITIDTPIDTNFIEPSKTILHNGSKLFKGSILNGDINERKNNQVAIFGPGNIDENLASEEQVMVSLTSLTTELDAIKTTTTTTMATTTTIAPRNCVVQRPYQSDQLVPEGNSRRIYSLDDTECSELCTCGDSLTLTCHALCVPFAPCRTALAFYSHASPAYQAFRGRCLCYSGRFICMRPPPGEYFLPGGVFLLLGYSSTDEALLRPHTNLGIQDAIRALQQYVIAHIDNQTSCTLTLFNMTDENIIISARLPHDPKVKSIEMLRREKTECTTILENISHHINSENNNLQAHRLLSIFKMAEVQVIWPEKNSSNNYPASLVLVINFCIFSKYLIPVIQVSMIKIFNTKT